MALGQFQHALSELQAWLNHTHATLDTQRPVNSDPKAIEIELAKHHVSHTHKNLNVFWFFCAHLLPPPQHSIFHTNPFFFIM